MGFSRIAVVSLCAALAALTASPASAGELLQNGGFEDGTTGWNGPGLSLDECVPHGGSSALGVSALVQQNVAGPLSSGEYTLTGWLMAQSGSPAVTASLVWLDGDGSEIAGAPAMPLTTGAMYSRFEFSRTAPSQTQSLRVRITVPPGNTVCLDDLSLEGPPAPTATPVPTAKPTSTVTPTATEQTPGPSPTALLSPTASTTAAPTTTATPTTTPTPLPGFSLLNGGFEEGLLGWKKHGGELRLADEPVVSGDAAAELVSSTESTKWAYQVVRVETSLAFEFSGYVRTGPGVSRAYLRISWYESTDGSGRAISTTDSMTVIESPGDFVFLTTGAVVPPPQASSARARVVMTPSSSAPAAVQFDDLSFVIALPPTPTPEATSTPAGTPELEGTARPTSESPTPILLQVNRPSPEAPDVSTPEPVQEDVLGVRYLATLSPAASSPVNLLDQPSPETAEDGRSTALWLVAAGLLVIGLGGSYLHGKRQRD